MANQSGARHELRGAEAAPVSLASPAPPQLRVTAAQVEIEGASAQARKVAAFVGDLADGPPGEAPPVGHLRVPHPSDARSYAALLARREGREVAADRPPAEDAAYLERSRAALLARWHDACRRLTALPSAARFGPVSDVFQSADPAACEGGHADKRGDVDVVVQVAMHSPGDDFARTQVVLASERHSLADLRDALRCFHDDYAARELRAPPLGALLFFNGVLYEDRRVAGATDFAGPILDFLRREAEEDGRRARAFLRQAGLAGTGATAAPPPPLPRVVPMQDAAVRDLTVQPTRPGLYLFVHAGACEHMLVVEDVRLRHASDPAFGPEPAILWQQPAALERCCVCLDRVAAKIVYGSRLLPCAPAFCCSQCFEYTHCDPSGRRLPEARAIDVYDLPP